MAQKDVSLSNWNLTCVTEPGAVVYAHNAEQISALVANESRYPSPVLAVGAMHSVTPCITNNAGTIVDLSGMNNVIGIEDGGVRVQAGLKLADLHDWLAKLDLEISFCPEIGDATVGSLVVCTSKDSSIDGPGYLSGLVTEVKYVDEAGHIVTLSRAKTPSELLAFTCSYGMMGIVVEAVLQVRRRLAVTSTAFTLLASSGAAAAKKLLKMQQRCDALFAILVPSRGYIYIEARNKAARLLTPLARSKAISAVGSLGGNDAARVIMQKLKYNCFFRGNPPGRKLSRLLTSNRYPTTHFRSVFVNRYPTVEPGSRRLDFSFLEFDFNHFEAVVQDVWQFHVDYQQRTGYGPRGYGMYFVDRGWAAKQQQQQQQSRPGSSSSSDLSSDGLLLRKPYGNFSGPPGVSFMLDPITDNCDDPQWLTFNVEYTAWAMSRWGAVPSPSQTKGLKETGAVLLPKQLTRTRFLTPYYAQFVG